MVSPALTYRLPAATFTMDRLVGCLTRKPIARIVDPSGWFGTPSQQDSRVDRWHIEQVGASAIAVHPARRMHCRVPTDSGRMPGGHARLRGVMNASRMEDFVRRVGPAVSERG